MNSDLFNYILFLLLTLVSYYTAYFYMRGGYLMLKVPDDSSGMILTFVGGLAFWFSVWLTCLHVRVIDVLFL